MVDIEHSEAEQPKPSAPDPDLDGLVEIELRDILQQARDAGFGVEETKDALMRALTKISTEEIASEATAVIVVRRVST